MLVDVFHPSDNIAIDETKFTFNPKKINHDHLISQKT